MSNYSDDEVRSLLAALFEWEVGLGNCYGEPGENVKKALQPFKNSIQPLPEPRNDYWPVLALIFASSGFVMGVLVGLLF